MDELELLAKSISDAVKRKEYSRLEPMMRDIFFRDDAVHALAFLIDRLPGIVLDALFLCGLSYLTRMSDEDYKELYGLLEGRNVAFYQLTRFLIIHGGARGRTLRRLCANFEEIRRIDQFQRYLKEEAELPGNEEKMNRLIYIDYKIDARDVLMFRDRLANS